ncbi:Smr/MutS family protein [Stigmatella sp. ncwal1]|uniref:Smr/MutS family protein n=1 Tax=Stigmatella ashevillensis TaxID=2995309 RepID=A0ABT5D7M7_9BACT|nr:Smr/MutS family protein [Stigmatella ashevillena]MDC0708858.1 Smr/MutS family protein [Stigmatella ashevillena]
MSRRFSPPPSEASVPETPFDEEVVEIPIDGNLDLHLFQPREVKELITEYLWACRQKGLLDVRIIHGKGTGALRKTVHSVLPRLSSVDSFRSADERDGGWGATWVRLKPLPPEAGNSDPPQEP